MARNVGTTVVPEITLHVDTIKQDGTVSERLFKIEDMITNLRYAANGKVNKISGRIANIKYNVAKTKRLYTSVAKAKSWFQYDVTAESITVDASTVNHSNLVEIPIDDLLEEEGDEDVKRLKYYLSYGINMEVVRSDDEVYNFNLIEGDILNNITYLFKGDETVLPTAKLIAIKRNGTTLNPTSIVLNLNNKLREIKIEQLVNIGEVSKPITVAGSIMSSIKADTDEEQVLYVDAGTYVEKLVIENNVTIKGNKSGIFGTSKNRDKKTLEDETIFTGAISIAKNAKVKLDGLVLTQDAIVSFTDNAEITIENCIVQDLNATTAKDHFVKGWTDTPVKVEVTNCYFGASGKSSNGVMYHIFELTCKLRDGTIFSGNYFEKDACTHNCINLYGIVDDATITIENNTWEYSGNAVRIGFKGSPKGTVNMNSNTYNTTDESEDGIWAGLVIFQTYAFDTVTFANVRVNINKTVHKDTHPVYVHFSTKKNGTVLTEEIAPQIYLNGKLQPKLNNHISQ